MKNTSAESVLLYFSEIYFANIASTTTISDDIIAIFILLNFKANVFVTIIINTIKRKRSEVKKNAIFPIYGFSRYCL